LIAKLARNARRDREAAFANEAVFANVALFENLCSAAIQFMLLRQFIEYKRATPVPVTTREGGWPSIPEGQ
jgi:hypothetical protein